MRWHSGPPLKFTEYVVCTAPSYWAFPAITCGTISWLELIGIISYETLSTVPATAQARSLLSHEMSGTGFQQAPHSMWFANALQKAPTNVLHSTLGSMLLNQTEPSPKPRLPSARQSSALRCPYPLRVLRVGESPAKYGRRQLLWQSSGAPPAG